MTDYPVIYEQADDDSWSVRAVDLPVFSVGDTREEAAEAIREAIALRTAVARPPNTPPAGGCGNDSSELTRSEQSPRPQAERRRPWRSER